MTWKITQTTTPGWLAVIGPYDEDFIEDIKVIRGARWEGGVKAWLVPDAHRAALDQVIIKHSPPPLVELKSGADGIAQIMELAQRLGSAAEIPDLVEGLGLAGIDVDGSPVAIEVGGRVLVVAVGDLP